MSLSNKVIDNNLLVPAVVPGLSESYPSDSLTRCTPSM